MALGIGNGNAKILDAASESLLFKMDPAREPFIPCTVVKWNPKSSSGICIAGSSNGVILEFHVPSMKRIYAGKEEMNQILTIDYDKTGNKFATAGKDSQVLHFPHFASSSCD